MTGATETLCAFVAGASKNTLPDDVVALAKQYTLDTIGAMIIGATKPWSQIVSSFSAGKGNAGGNATIVGSTTPSSPSMAALANGNAGHGFEIDDVHDESLTHPGVVAVPAAMAVAEESGASGLDFLIAVAMGYEVVGRVGLAVGAVPHMLGGFYPTGTSGVFGAAAAASRLLGADAKTLTNALGIAGSFASGIVECTETGGMVKRLHAGRAAEGGVTAAYLAQGGFTGPGTVLEGKFGFCRSFSKAPELHRLLEGLGTRYMIREITVKPYACCSDIHPVIDALLDIVAAHPIAPADIRHILVESTTKLFQLNNIDGTTSMMAAQYSVPFTAALVLRRDIRDPTIYQDAILRDDALRSLQGKVEMRASPEFDAIYPRVIGARVTVTMNDGRTLAAANRGATGSIHKPMSKSAIESKFMRLADPILPQGRAKQVLQRLATLEDAPRADALTHLLRFEAQ